MEKSYQILIHNLNRADTLSYWTGLACAAFAVAFFIVGSTRTVEIQGLGLSLFRQRVLKALHIVGCLIFSLSLLLLGLDVQRRFDKPTGALFMAGLILLFPVHIYIGVLRRVETTRRQSKA